jgi:hypothetical protein
MEQVSARHLAKRLFGRAPGARLALIRAFWPLAVGADTGRRTEVVALEGRTLRIRVPDARWRKVLHRMQREILGRLFASIGDLAPSQLSFVEGPVADPAPPPALPSPAMPPAASPELMARAAAIADPELRERFLSTAARYLSRAKVPRTIPNA